MAETTKKKKASKKSTKKTTKKSTVALAETTTELKSKPAKKTKATTKKKATTVKKDVTHFVKDPIPTEDYSEGRSFFTTLLALLIVAGVVLAGYVYAQKKHMDEPAIPLANPFVQTAPQRVSVSSAVKLSPEVVASLESLAGQVNLSSDEVLENVRYITDVSAAQSESPTFFTSVQSGDMVFEFRTMRVLFRPSSKEVIKSEAATNQ